MARVLITRPIEDAEPLAALLHERGHTTLIAPLLDVHYHNSPLDLTGAQALLFTSANGVRAAARATEQRDIPALCVGDATAREASHHGFQAVASADGDVSGLADLVRTTCDPALGPLVHVAGTVVAGQLAETLTAAGFTVRRVVLYDAETAAALPAEVANALRADSIDAVMVFSPRTAKTFVKLVHNAGLAPHTANMDMLCLSEAVAQALGDVPRRMTRIAVAPTQNALIDLL